MQYWRWGGALDGNAAGVINDDEVDDDDDILPPTEPDPFPGTTQTSSMWSNLFGQKKSKQQLAAKDGARPIPAPKTTDFNLNGPKVPREEKPDVIEEEEEEQKQSKQEQLQQELMRYHHHFNHI